MQQEYLSVNWTDGMKINKSHFIAHDNACTFTLAQSAASLLNDHNYGLLPGKSGMDLSLYLSIDSEQQIQLRVQRCRAITKSGHYIKFEEDTALKGNNLYASILALSKTIDELKSKASVFYIIVSIAPYQRIPFGAADANEYPPRIPFTKPTFNISLLQENELTINSIGEFHIPVGRVIFEDQKVRLDEGYIPPCSSLSSHFTLLEFHALQEQFCSKLEQYALQIIQRIMQKKQVNDIASIALKLCENIIIFTASNLSDIKSEAINQPPVHLISRMTSLARLFKNSLDYYSGSGKEEFVNYCREWCDVSQGEIENCISALVANQYNHLDIRRSIEKISLFTRIFADLFKNLAQLDYIGKRKDSGIFVKELVVDNLPSLNKTRSSFLAD